jgi:hypothetical protein
MKLKITQKIPKLKSKAEAFMNVIIQDKFLDVNSDKEKILVEVEELDITCASLVEKSKNIENF